MTQDDDDRMRQVRSAGSTALAFHLAFNKRPDRPEERPAADGPISGTLNDADNR